jgi:hypothetical protein
MRTHLVRLRIAGWTTITFSALRGPLAPQPGPMDADLAVS